MIYIKSLLFQNFPNITLALSTSYDLRSKKPFHFNLSYTVGDDENIVTENRKVFFNKIGLTSNNVAYQNQIHSDIIKETDFAGNCGESDALITNKIGIGLAVSVADCTPIFLYDKSKNVIAAVHSGWRGTKEKILTKTLLKLKNKYNSNPEDLICYIGPSISKENYEVGKEFKDIFKEKYLKKKSNKFLLDVKTINYDMLLEFSVPKQNIQVSNLCTFEMSNLLHSYRRDGKTSGRILGIIALNEYENRKS